MPEHSQRHFIAMGFALQRNQGKIVAESGDHFIRMEEE